MSKSSLLTTGKLLGASNELYLLSVHDLEPSGVMVSAYNQNDSSEYLLPITEMELARAGYTRSSASLMSLLETIYLDYVDADLVLQSTDDNISRPKRKVSPELLDKLLQSPLSENSTETLNELLSRGLVELCKCKPVGLNASEWLGNWLLANNPNMPRVDVPDE